ncbi:MAG: hypothetical protein F6K19_01690 [Cyanothece sp. SIO1E1]|nr:hypothetical protein [Cyanothece sp. SIO1E1]
MLVENSGRKISSFEIWDVKPGNITKGEKFTSPQKLYFKSTGTIRIVMPEYKDDDTEYLDIQIDEIGPSLYWAKKILTNAGDIDATNITTWR